MPTAKSTPAARESADALALLAGLEHPHKAGIEALRRCILALSENVTEEVKWNAPSFRIEDHFATFRLHPAKSIQLVLHTGAKVKKDAKAFRIDDPAGLLKWPAADRAVLTFASEAELQNHMADVTHLLRQWIAQL
jgi:predicted transport protein